MPKSVAIVGAGVSGLTCGVLFAERRYRTAIFAEQSGQETTSGAAAALWFPYDCEPRTKVVAWALTTYRVLVGLASDPRSGVSMLQLRQYSRTGALAIPEWAHSLGAHCLSLIPSARRAVAQRRREVEESLTFASIFKSGFAMKVPLMDTTIYLDYLTNRFRARGGEIHAGVRFDGLDAIDPDFDIVINCAGIGARELLHDVDLEPHRGQVAVVPKINNLSCAVVCDEEPLMYAIPRTNDCLFGGTNELSDNLAIDRDTTSRIVNECVRTLKIDKPRVLAERVGLRPYRNSGVRLERDKLRDGRTIIHNYGHGGSGFTLSWGCAEEVFKIAD
ncbi:MAG TPA: FAD-dependent oxidoreductase, partial [Chthoniobacterales bacterium]|nr:FAD-dependent oxidoreductase [Chthoniobacterales bacterium]